MLLAVLLQLLLYTHPEPCSAQTTLADVLLNSPGQWPPYVRGKGEYKFVLSPRALRNGVTYTGANDRLRVALDRWQKGNNLTITAVGGSITAGQGAVDAPNYPQYVQNYLQDQYGPSVQLTNGAVGGTLSSYMALCHNVHVPKAVDIVFVEYNQNDHGLAMPPFLNNHRRTFERLLRKLLSYPRKPAVVLMHSFSWKLPDNKPGTFWASAEADFDTLAHYYHLPTLSVKAACYNLMVQQVPGFWANVTRNTDEKALAEKSFYYDDVHPDGRTGVRVMAELAIHLIESSLQDLAASPVTEQDKAAVELPLAVPMVPDNHHSLHDQCFIGHAFTNIVTRSEGFEWINESDGPRSKWGMVATKVGSVLELTLDTRASTHTLPSGLSNLGPLNEHEAALVTAAAIEANAAAAQQAQKRDMLVELGYLQSYEHMGTADVSCVSGCTCKPVVLDGHTGHHTSQLHMMNLLVTQHEQCVIRVQVRPETSSGSHKVKVAACIVSEEAGWKSGIQNHRAVEYVHDISFNSKDNSFDVRNHARLKHRMLAAAQ